MIRTKVIEPAQWKDVQFECPECGRMLFVRKLGKDNTHRCDNCGALIGYEEVNDETN